MLGANTPPSPPAPNVRAAAKGFKKMRNNKLQKDITVKSTVLLIVFCKPK